METPAPTKGITCFFTKASCKRLGTPHPEAIYCFLISKLQAKLRSQQTNEPVPKFFNIYYLSKSSIETPNASVILSLFECLAY
jgi:hypothetical protein